MRERGIYDVDAIRRDIERHRQGVIDVSNGLFAIAQFETWAEGLALTASARDRQSAASRQARARSATASLAASPWTALGAVIASAM
jgi:hypothetical protein